MSSSFDDALGLSGNGPTWEPPAPPTRREQRAARWRRWRRRIRRRFGRSSHH